MDTSEIFCIHVMYLRTNSFHDSVPHPSENVINVRIQMYGMYPDAFMSIRLDITLVIVRNADGLSSLDALIDALTELDKICESVEDAYLASLRKGEFERWDEKR